MKSPGGDQDCPYSRLIRRLHLALIFAVLALAITGYAIYFREALGVQKLKLKLVYAHAFIAYAFLVVLACRLAIGVFGGAAESLAHAFPRKSDFSALAAASRGERKHRAVFRFAGRSPLSRVISGAMFAAIAIMVATGSIRLATDIFFPPFGALVQRYLAVEGVEATSISPRDAALIDPQRQKALNKLKPKIGKIHIYTGFFILGAALVHVVGVIGGEWSAPNNPAERGRARLMLFGPRARKCES